MDEFYLIDYSLDNIDFKRELEEDPITMGYNAGLNYPDLNYDRETGVYHRSKDDYRDLVESYKKNGYAGIVARKSDNKFIGEVGYHISNTPTGYDISIVLKPEFRGKGYSYPAMELILKKAIEKGINKINHIVPANHEQIHKTDYKLGFKKVDEGVTERFGIEEKIDVMEYDF